MKEEIKNRIEAVRRGEVPEGYVLENHQLRPGDWTYEKIGPYLTAYDEYSNDTEEYPLATSSRQGLMLQSEYYNDQRYDETEGGFHVVPVGYITYRHMSDDDIFRFNVNDMDKPVLVSPEYPVFKTKHELNQNLLVTYLNGMKEFRAYSSSQKKGSTRTRMYFSRLGEFSMPIPPLAEQHKIAEILAACDKVIELKQKLIEEKEDQKLFYAKRIFDSATTFELLENLAEIVMGQSPDSNSYNENKVGLPLLQGNADMLGRIPHPRFYTSKPTKECKEGDILLSVRAPVGTVQRSNITACIGRGLCAIRAHNLGDYLYQYLTYYEPMWNRVSQGSTFTAINSDEVGKVTVPLFEAEKIKTISNLLSSMDEEIDMLKQELAVWLQKKKALMQLLLTGLVRVKT